MDGLKIGWAAPGRTYSESGRCVDSEYGRKWSLGGRFRVPGILKVTVSQTKSVGRHLEGHHSDRKRIRFKKNDSSHQKIDFFYQK